MRNGIKEDWPFKRISVIVPCYNEEESLPILYDEICKVSEKLDAYRFEIVLINDGSSDRTIEIMRKLAKEDERIHYISFSRNFGKESAMLAGLRESKGDYVAILDADMQDPPGILPQMLEILENEECQYDVVATRRVDRKGEPLIRSFFARCFYKLMNRMSETEIVDGARDFRLMRRKVVDAILSVGEYNRFSTGIFSWVGFPTKWLEYENKERVAGETKWSFWKLFLYSISGIIDFSTKPLAMASLTGTFFCVLAFVMMIFVIIRTVIWGDPVAGWPSLVCIILFTSGIQLFSIGILGQYLSRTYMEAKHRPSYLIRETEKDLLSWKDENTDAE
ncbi:MAG: glycosyltransferase family 2 protein [Clostridia bacterium]|nr:glycosyltransferase family 2 protein [Clostridia bacterium]